MNTKDGPRMRLFVLQRNFDPDWTDADFDRMVRRAVGGLHWDPPVVWHRSFGIDVPGPVTGFCVYGSETLRTLLEQQRMCWVPFTEAREVQEACGDASGLGPCEPPEGTSLFLVERIFDAPALLSRVAQSNTAAQTGRVRWVRSYWDAERRHSRCIFAAPEARDIENAVCDGTITAIAPVLEEHPSALADIYDQAGVPRSWEAPQELAPASL